MTKQFAIDGSFRDGSTVDGEIGRMFARGVVVYDFWEMLFTRS